MLSLRWLSIVMLCAAGSGADAAPDRRLELGVRLGIQSTRMVFSDDAPMGKGPLVDASAGWRFTPWLSLSLAVAYSSIHDSFQDPFDPNKTYDAHVKLVDVGPRLSFHHRGVIAGMGLAAEFVSYTGDTTAKERGSLFELHLGYTFPRIDAIGGGAIQVLGMVTQATTPYDGDNIQSLRFGAGIEF